MGVKKRILYPFISWIVIWAIVCLSGCGMIGRQQRRSWLDYFDTLTNLTIYDSQSDGDKLFNDLEEMMSYYDHLFDIYHNYDGMNNLKTVNDCAGIKSVEVDEDLIDMLKLAVKMYEDTNGQLNIAMGSVLSIWHEYRESGMEHPELARVPDQALLEAAATHTNIDCLIIDEQNRTVYLEDPEMSLDVGAIAKGYAAQKIGEYIRNFGTKHALLDMSSTIIAVGSKSDGQKWRLAVQNPIEATNEAACVAEIQDVAFVTSGDYQRYYEVDGQRYHHIIDPDTLMPADGFSSVSVISDNAAIADALSTALFCLSLQDGRDLIEKYENTEALWIDCRGHIEMTEGFKSFITD